MNARKNRGYLAKTDNSGGKPVSVIWPPDVGGPCGYDSDGMRKPTYCRQLRPDIAESSSDIAVRKAGRGPPPAYQQRA
jgi:hypothetical protein